MQRRHAHSMEMSPEVDWLDETATVNIRSLFSEVAISEPYEMQQREFALLRLPAELRLDIYQLVASAQPAVVLTITSHETWHERKLGSLDGISLLMTCKQVRREAYDMVWNNLVFEIGLLPFLPRDNIRIGRGRSLLGIIENTIILREMRQIRIHLMAGVWNTVSHEKMCRTLQSNIDITNLELYIYGPWRSQAILDCANSAFRKYLSEHCGELLRALKEKQVPVTLIWHGGHKDRMEVL